jgi:predicted DNA-binding transcriptional regulator AlpA
VRHQIDRRALNSAKQKSEDHLLKMGEVCALCQDRLGISRTTYYDEVRPLIADDFTSITPTGSMKRMKKGDLLEELEELGDEGFPA